MVRTLIVQPEEDQEKARLAKFMFLAGCFFLPWLWIVNVSYFWSQVYGGENYHAYRRRRRPTNANVELYKWVTRSLVGSIIAISLLIVWIVTFQLRWKSLGSDVLPFMISKPESYATGW